MVGVQAIMSLAFSVSAPFLPLFIMELGVHPLSAVDVWSGATAGVGFLTAAAFSPVWGALADRIGRKTMVVRSSAAVCFFFVVCGLAPNVETLFVARVCMGVFTGFSAAALALVGTQVPSQRLGFSLGWMATGQVVGSLCGPLLGGLLADRVGNYRVVFFLTSAFSLVATLTCAALVREDFISPPRIATKGRSIVQRLDDIRRVPGLPRMLVVVFLAQVVTLGVQPVIPLYVHSLMGDSRWLGTVAGAAFAVTGIADLIASPLLGRRSDTIGYRKVLLISLAGVACCTVSLAFAGTIVAFLVLRFGTGIFLGGVLPTANAWIGVMAPEERRGQIYGITSSAAFLGMFAGPLLAGLIASRFGIAAVFVTLGLLAATNLTWIALTSPRPA